jgi:bacterial/archaeal transporter family protein
MWLYLGISSALFLGIYDIFKKGAVHRNAVPQVLFATTLFGALTMLPIFVLSRIFPEMMADCELYAGLPDLQTHLLIGIKTVIVSISWLSAYFALKHLPISIVAPIRASAPIWTLLGAVGLFQEALHAIHWVGITITFVSYYLFSIVGKREGIRFFKNRSVALVFVATFTGALSALYDKYLLQARTIPPITLQVWFSFYLVGATGLLWYLIHRLHPAASDTPFQWRLSIPMVGLFLIIADFLYFRTLSQPEALIAVVSMIRRSSVVVSFLLGSMIFKEKNRRAKTVPLIGVLLGIALLLIDPQ